ncbi:S8 family peptidase [Sediminitomix flava]|uniref:Thermitase n=1 Tax=Sediminitomix flava TaxID=379075 RepID=A0A315Z5Y1_SEDFL|nr:S8 family serine peptidase [Sediminitomix flava]PWJ37986.1 thermitase [Sediminitomix flava]
MLNFLSSLYPISLFLMVAVFATWYTFDLKGIRHRLFGYAKITSASIFLLSFFVSYKLEWATLLWLARDISIFVVLMSLYETFLKYKLITSTVVLTISSGIGFNMYQAGNLNFHSASSSFSANKGAELLINIKNTDQLAELQSLLKPFDASFAEAFPHLQSKGITDLDECYTIDLKDASQQTKLIEALRSSGLVDWVEENETIKLKPNKSEKVSSAKKNWKHLNDPLLTNVWEFNYLEINELSASLRKLKPKKKASIYILDTGVDGNHEDLNANYISLDKKYDSDTDIHGTHCAGIASAVSNNKLGIASLNFENKFTTITGITVLPNGSGTQEAIIDGIILAADNGADVISMSLGGRSNDKRQRAYNKAIEYANKKGAIVVVAAGNEAQNATKSVPASCKNVITVSAVGNELQMADFSNFVNDIEYKVAAPGVGILSTVPNNKYESLDGTSMATPYVAGIIGILKSLSPELTTAEVYKILSETGIDTNETKLTGKFIQPNKALNKLDLSSSIWDWIWKVLFNFNPLK